MQQIIYYNCHPNFMYLISNLCSLFQYQNYVNVNSTKTSFIFLRNQSDVLECLKYAFIVNSVSKKIANIDIIFGLKLEFVKNDIHIAESIFNKNLLASLCKITPVNLCRDSPRLICMNLDQGVWLYSRDLLVPNS